MISDGYQCQQAPEPGSRMIGDAAEYIGEPGLGADAVEFGGSNQTIVRGRALA